MPQDRKLETVNTRIEDGVGVVQINNPKQRNTLNWQVHYDMLKVLDEYKEHKDVACILLCGNEDYFSSGWEITLLKKSTASEKQAFSDIALKLMIGVYD